MRGNATFAGHRDTRSTGTRHALPPFVMTKRRWTPRVPTRRSTTRFVRSSPRWGSARQLDIRIHQLLAIPFRTRWYASASIRARGRPAVRRPLIAARSMSSVRPDRRQSRSRCDAHAEERASANTRRSRRSQSQLRIRRPSNRWRASRPASGV